MISYSTRTDEQLMSLLKKSDRGAFTEVYNRYWEILFAISYNYSKSKEVAEEIVQDTLMRLWDRRGELDIKDAGAYLATAVKFGVFKHITREKRRKELVVRNLEFRDSVDEEAKINALFLTEYVNAIVERLPDQCRIVYRLRRQEDLSVQEIAEKLQISPKTAGNHLNKALKSIRLSLKESYLSVIIL